VHVREVQYPKSSEAPRQSGEVNPIGGDFKLPGIGRAPSVETADFDKARNHSMDPIEVLKVNERSPLAELPVNMFTLEPQSLSQMG
jgi:hypothetical protein